MALTVEQALFHASHSIGGAGQQSDVGGLAILNYAGQYLCGSRGWRWLEQQQVKLDLVKDQAYVWLPRGLQSIVALDMTQGLTSGMNLTTHQHLVELRTSAITTSTWLYWAALTHAVHEQAATATIEVAVIGSIADTETVVIDDGFNPAVTFTFNDTVVLADTETVIQVDVDTASDVNTAQNLADAINGAPTLLIHAGDSTTAAIITLTHGRKGVAGNSAWTITDNTTTGALVLVAPAGGVDPGPVRPRLDIWPAATGNSEDAVTLYFEGGWGTLDEDTILLAIPEWFEPLYIETVRQVARGFEMEDDMPMSDRMGNITDGALFQGAIRVDDHMIPDYGRMRGGAVTGQVSGGAANMWNFNSVSAPS